jgi:glycosyltransferase involved in cell wall biosynthesis
MKYPYVILFRYDEHSYIDEFFNKNKDNLLCSVFIVNNKEALNKLFNCSYQILVTYGNDTEGTFGDDKMFNEVNSIIGDAMRKQWIHIKASDRGEGASNSNIDINNFNTIVNYCYMSIITLPVETIRPIFSIFTTCYKSYDKIKRAYDSIKLQTLKHWEWVILDDTPESEHFIFLRELFKDDHRIRLYKRSENSGNIGNVKNEVVSLCRGKYVIELDHDDEILPDILQDATNVFDKNDEIGFIYMDYINLYENKTNFKYGDFFSLGYGGYYRQKYNNMWVYVSSHGNINNITLSHIVSVPNHPRIWRRKTLLEMGNYSEYLPISDDYELLVRTAVKTKIAKIHKLGYVQYMNDGGNNFSYIRNSEINRLRYHLTDHCYKKYDVQETMKKLNAHEDEKYMNEHIQIWKCDNYDYKYCNEIINVNYKKQYCIIGLETLYCNMDEILKLYQDNNNDFIVLDNKNSSDTDILCTKLDNLGLDKMKCYEMNDCNDMQLINYFNLIYKSCNDYKIYERNACDSPNRTHSPDIPDAYNTYDAHHSPDTHYAPYTTDIPDAYNTYDALHCPEKSNSPDIPDAYNTYNTPHSPDAPYRPDKPNALLKNHKKKITLITPSIRPENLLKIMDSIRFEYINKWIIVYDGSKIVENPKLFINDKIEEHIYKGDGISGNPQRNYALDLLKDTDTYLYYLDDDNIIHPELYNLLDNIEDDKMYTFDQQRPDNIFPFKTLLKGNDVTLFNIDTAMILIDYNLCKDIRWVADKYNADGLYITECYTKNKDKWIYIDKLMAYYNPV